jgi:hypothetical protein
MTACAKIVSGIAFVGTIVPPLLLFAGVVSLDQMKWWMLVATFVWFAATPLWMDRATGDEEGGRG